MHINARRLGGALCALLILPAVACTSSSSSPAKASVYVLPGGCAGTVVTDSEPPTWAQAGFTIKKGTPWVPWALGTDGNAVAYLFARQLVAGPSPRTDGTNNKILWVLKDSSFSAVEGRPMGRVQPVIEIPAGPSIVDVPTAGCWTFRALWGAHKERSSTINLEVLPAGTLPAK
jgi:hypothetical protein